MSYLLAVAVLTFGLSFAVERKFKNDLRSRPWNNTFLPFEKTLCLHLVTIVRYLEHLYCHNVPIFYFPTQTNCQRPSYTLLRQHVAVSIFFFSTQSALAE